MKKISVLIIYILIMSQILQPQVSVFADEADVLMEENTLPDYYMTEKLPPLRNQGSYETCWAHTNMALAEIYAMNHPDEFSFDPGSDFSEAQMAYFTYNTVEDPTGGTKGDSNGFKTANKNAFTFGGSLLYSENVMNTWTGAVSENIMPYSDIPSFIKASVSSDLAYSQDCIHMKGYRNWDLIQDREDIKAEIMNNGAVGSRIYSSYSYYNSKNNSYYYPGSNGVNHAITLVGWDDNFSKDKFNTKPAGDGAWIVRNSWVKSDSLYYGYTGYFYLSYYDKKLDYAYAYDFEDTEAHDTCYQYDGGMITQVLDTPVIAGANIFKTQSSEYGDMLDTVGFYSDGYDASYQIDVYVALKDNEIPQQGIHIEEAAVQGVTTAPGFYSVPLSKPVYLPPESRFCTVVTFLEENDDTGLGFEMASPDSFKSYYSSVEVNKGESYYKKPSSKWIDIAKVENMSDYGNIRIKAYTKRAVSENICEYIRPAETEDDKDDNDEAGEEQPGNEIIPDTKPLPDDKPAPEDKPVPDDKEDGNKPAADNKPNSSDSSASVNPPADITDDIIFVGTNPEKCENCIITSKEPIPEGSYQITYDLQTDVDSITNYPNVFYYTGGNKIKLLKPVRKGYTFKGWYDKATGKRYRYISKKQSGNIELVARWSENHYSIKFIKGVKGYTKGVAGKHRIVKNIAYSTLIKLPNHIFTRYGYEFKGWSESSKLNNVTYNTTDVLYGLETRNKKTLKLYAVWEPK